MKFAHMADCHIGAWRDSKLKELNTKAFARAIDDSMANNVDFIIISGDLFNTPLPSIECLKSAVTKLKQLKDNSIPVYALAGSHDFSPSGKTILDVLDEAGLLINVVKGKVVENTLNLDFTVDEKTRAKLTGMLGKKGSLEKSFYQCLDLGSLEREEGCKIFMFHSGLTEYKPSELSDTESQPLSLLPKGFSYYAGGHVHYVFQKHEKDYGLVAYPGPLFPNSFSELENLEVGGFFIVELENRAAKAVWHPIQVANTEKMSFDCNNMSPEQIYSEILGIIQKKEFINSIVLIRLYGTMSSGKPSDINFKAVYDELYARSAYFVMRNTAKLASKDFEEIKVDTKSVDDIESSVIREHLGQVRIDGLAMPKEQSLIKELMEALSFEKEDLSKTDFENKIKEDLLKIIEI